MDEQLEGEKTTKYISSLPDSIRSLHGSNPNITSSWFESVFRIIKDLQSSKSVSKADVDSHIFEKMDSNSSVDSDEDVSVIKLKDKLLFLNVRLNQLTVQRRCAVNDFLDLKGSIRVFCRIRPFLPDETKYNQGTVSTTVLNSVVLRTTNNTSKQYDFDKVFHQQSTQEEVFTEIKPMIKSALDGYNVCIFAYGQTGTGKTYTMEGQSNNLGVVPRVISALFQQALETNYTFEFTFSMLEIYMGNLRDLFHLHNTKQSVRKLPCLSIQMSSSGIIEIENLQAVKVNNLQEVMRLYKYGSHIRSTACTNSNSASSRSHCLTCISVTSYGEPERRRKTNKIWMVDLAGSERLLKTQASGKRLEEGKSINLSLSALGDVISALKLKKKHIPYRNSKLTQVLRDSLGSDSKTLMLVHVSPKDEDICETICSLSFATRVRSIDMDNDVAPDIRAKKEVEMAALKEKIMTLESEHQDLRRSIRELNEKLRCFDKLDSVDHPDTEVSVLHENKLQCDKIDHQKKDNGNSAEAAWPRFMRPTACSRRRTNPGHVTSINGKKKPPIVPRNRRTSSVYAESLKHDTKIDACHSEYGSESGMSKTSFTICGDSVDENTEYSHDNPEYDVKKIIFPEEQRPSIASVSIKSAYTSLPNINQMEKSYIDNWLHSQKTVKTQSNNQNGRALLPVANEEKQQECGQRCEKKEILSFSTISSETFNQAKLKNFHENTIVDEVNNSMPYANLDTGYSELKYENLYQSARRNCPIVLNEINKQTKIGSEACIPVGQADNCAENNVNVHCSTNKDYSGSETHQRTEEEPETQLCESSEFEKQTERDQTDGSEDNTAPITNSQEEKQGSQWELLKTLQMLWASALLGLGIPILGLTSEFFQGLTM